MNTELHVSSIGDLELTNLPSPLNTNNTSFDTNNYNNYYNVQVPSVAAPTQCLWQGIDRSFVTSARAIEISLYEQRHLTVF